MIGVGSGDAFEPDSPNFEHQAGSLTSPKMVDMGEFLLALKKAYEDHKIEVIPAWVNNVEAFPSCLASWGSCPTEKDWCSQDDPSCNNFVYQASPASLNGFGIALTSILVIGFVSLSAYVFKCYSDGKQQKRHTSHFAMQPADRIGQVGHREEEFKRIDNGLQSTDGVIQKASFGNGTPLKRGVE